VASTGDSREDGRVTDALTSLHDAATLWSAGFGGPEEVVRAACDVLASGEDGPTLAMLAALPLRGLHDSDLADLLAPALAEVGLPYVVPHSREAEEATLVVMAQRTLAGAMSPRELALWAHRAFGHDRLALATRLAELDDDYDTVEYLDRVVTDVDAEVLAEARRITASPVTPRDHPSARTP